MNKKDIARKMPFNRRRLSFRGCLPEKYAAAQQNTTTQKVITADRKKIPHAN